jgi:hypothetical protein
MTKLEKIGLIKIDTKTKENENKRKVGIFICKEMQLILD